MFTRLSYLKLWKKGEYLSEADVEKKREQMKIRHGAKPKKRQLTAVQKKKLENRYQAAKHEHWVKKKYWKRVQQLLSKPQQKKEAEQRKKLKELGHPEQFEKAPRVNQKRRGKARLRKEIKQRSRPSGVPQVFCLFPLKK